MSADVGWTGGGLLVGRFVTFVCSFGFFLEGGGGVLSWSVGWLFS